MNAKKRVTWAQVAAACKARKGSGLYVSWDDFDRRVLRCNNGWIQARKPAAALAFVLNCVY